MADVTEEVKQITSRRLGEILGVLGFVRRDTEEIIAYRETQHGAFIVLPQMSEDSLVGDPHLVMVRNTVTGKGITSWEDFEALLAAPAAETAAVHMLPQAPQPDRVLTKPRRAATKSASVKKRTASVLA